MSCTGGSNIEYSVTGSNIPAGVAWSLIPNLSGSGGAAIQPNADWHYREITPGNIATNYKVRATAMHNVNFFDEVDLKVVKVDIVQTSAVGYVYYTNCVGFNLATGRSWNVFWKISPDLGTNGAQFSARPRWTGSGTNVWRGTNVWVYSGPVSNNYTIRATAIEDTNCADTAVLEVLQPGFLDLNWLETTNESLHHTSAYQTNALVLRRADKFKVEAKLSRGYTNAYYDVWFQAVDNLEHTPKTNDIPVVANDLSATDWYCKLLSVSNNADETKTVQMEINIPSTNCPIGEYQWRAVVTPKALTKVVLDATNFPGQVIILFNPWSANDSVYMANDNERMEYVLRSSGKMWRGNYTNKTTKLWQYAQFSNSTLSILIGQLSANNANAITRADTVQISRILAAIIRNADQGIIEGKWEPPYDAGTDPLLWDSSDVIFEQYISSNVTVKYAQCWVYGGLLTSLLRCSGIPARPITNYKSADDKDGTKIIEFRYKLINGVWKNIGDSSWNYHVWCDAWMKRPDQTGQDGWQAVDATYEIGPASVTAVKGDSGGNYNIDFVWAEVSADYEEYMWINDTWILVDFVPNPFGKDISTKTVGSSDRNDITAEYK